MPELFTNFEINRNPHWPILLRLVGISLIFHLTLLASVIYLPTMRDAFNIAALLGNTGYVDKPYSKTELGEDVRMISLAEKFHYPEGYFARDLQSGLASQTEITDPFAPKIISKATREKPESTPTPAPTPEASPSPSPQPSTSVDSGTAEAANSNSSPPRDPGQTEQELNKIAAENSVVRPNENEINTRPLKDWLARANDLKVKGELDLSAKIEITIAANLTSGCKLGDARVIQKSGDARLTDLAKDMVSAIGDSGMLSFLRDPKKVTNTKEIRCDEIPLQLTLKLDQNEVTARVESQADSPDRAAEMARGYNGLLTVGQLVKRGKDEEVLYKNTKVTSAGRQIVVSFAMPRQAAGEMLSRQIQPKPSG